MACGCGGVSHLESFDVKPELNKYGGRSIEETPYKDAVFGSLERLIGLLTEQYAGAFPFWLAPVQATILPISDRHNAYAYAIPHAA